MKGEVTIRRLWLICCCE